MIQLKDLANTKFQATEEELKSLGLTFTNQDITFVSQKPTNLFFINSYGFIKRHMNGNSEQPNTPMIKLKDIADNLKNGTKTLNISDLKVELFQGHPISSEPSLLKRTDNMKKMTREQIQEKYHSPDQPGIMHAMFDEVVDFVIDNYDFQPAFDKKLAMKNFFDTYSNDIEGTLHNMNQETLLEYLDGDIFIGCASAATGIPEKEFVEYSLEYFGFVDKAV